MTQRTKGIGAEVPGAPPAEAAVLSPSQQLANRIVERLAKEKLIALAKDSTFPNALAEGTLTGETWRLEVEKASRKKTP